MHLTNKNTCAPTPPMGWNSYDYYDTTVDEAAVKANADYMAKHLKAYGWEYIVVDIQWYAKKAGSMRDRYQYIPFSELEMDEYSRLLPDPERFPSSADGSGFKPLADYVHSLGLKFGIHIMRGIPRIAAHHHGKIKNSSLGAEHVADPTVICGWNPDMYGVRDLPEGQLYYDSLLELYASWGVDYIKCDDICNTNMHKNPFAAAHEIEMLSNASAIRNMFRGLYYEMHTVPSISFPPRRPATKTERSASDPDPEFHILRSDLPSKNYLFYPVCLLVLHYVLYYTFLIRKKQALL